MRRAGPDDVVGGAALGWSCFGASDHGPVSFRRVGQAVDLPAKARRWGHDLRGSPQSGCLKPWSRPPRPGRVLTHAARPTLIRARVGAARAERAEGRSGARSGAGKRARRSGAQPGLDEVGKVLSRCDEVLAVVAPHMGTSAV
jgi:hypothetical protein